MSQEQTVLLCRAPHPRALRGDGRFRGRICGKRLQIVPFRARPTYRSIDGWDDVHDGCIAVRCLARDCRAFTEYEIVDPPSSSGALRSEDEASPVDEPSSGPSVRRPTAAGTRHLRPRRRGRDETVSERGGVGDAGRVV